MMFYVVLLTFALQSRADDAIAAPPTLKVAGITQFIEGSAKKIETSGAQTEVIYQTALYEGDRLETTETTSAKFASRSGCLFILRGKGTLAVPVGQKPWRMRADSLRLICSGRAKPETIGVDGRSLSITNGEVLFFDKNSVLLIDGAASLTGAPVAPRVLYKTSGKTATRVEPQPSEAQLRAINLEQKPPRESRAWLAPPGADPERASTKRVIFGPDFAYERAFFDNKGLNQGKLTGTGPRLQFHFRTAKDRSLIVAVSFVETDDASREGQSNVPAPSGVSNTIERSLLEVGMRSHHDRWWSPFWRVGLGYAKAKVGFTSDTFFYSRYLYEFYVASATYGIDAHLTPHWLRPFGLYASAEGQLIESLFRGGRINDQQGFSSGVAATPAEPWRLTTVNLGLNLGVQYDF